MQANHGAQEDTPEKIGPSTDGQQNKTERGDRHPVPLADPGMKLVFAQFGNIRKKLRRMVLHGAPGDDPSHVRPEAAMERGMRVAFFVSILMMDAMHCHPEKRSALQGQGAAQGEEILNPFVGLESAMGQQPVIAHADAQASSHPPQHQRQQHGLPTEHEKSGDRAEVKYHHKKSSKWSDRTLKSAVVRMETQGWLLAGLSPAAISCANDS